MLNSSITIDASSAHRLSTSIENSILENGISYGLSVRQYCQLLAKQNGVCTICCQPERHVNRFGAKKDRSVDHDHETGEIRGLLCSDCNTALGLLQDEPDILARAIDYLLNVRSIKPEDPATVGKERKSKRSPENFQAVLFSKSTNREQMTHYGISTRTVQRIRNGHSKDQALFQLIVDNFVDKIVDNL